MTPDELKIAYKAFFKDSEAGQDFMKRLSQILESNLGKATDQNSLDYLARYKGNKEALQIIELTIGGLSK
jgi:hypothetical protein